MLQKSLKISVIFKKSEKLLKSRFPNSKIDKNLRFFYLFFFLVGRVPDDFGWLKSCLKWSVMMSWRVLPCFWFIWRHFFLTNFHFLGICMAIWGFGLGTLRWIHCGNGIRSGVAWETETSCFGQKWSTIMTMNSAKEFEPLVSTLRCWQPSQGTISAL